MTEVRTGTNSKNTEQKARPPRGPVFISADVDEGKRKGQFPKVVMLAVGRCSLTPLWSVPSFHMKHRFSDPEQQVAQGCNPWEKDNSTFTLTFYLDFSKVHHRKMGPEETRACGNVLRIDQQINRTEYGLQDWAFPEFLQMEHRPQLCSSQHVGHGSILIIIFFFRIHVYAFLSPRWSSPRTDCLLLLCLFKFLTYGAEVHNNFCWRWKCFTARQFNIKVALA